MIKAPYGNFLKTEVPWIMNMKIKTPEEIQKKYEELNRLMGDRTDTRILLDEMAEITDGKKEMSDSMMLKMLLVSSNNVSTDAQRYLLEWVMCQHD